VSAMRGAADRFIGMKDLGAFTDDDPDEKSTRVLLDRLELAECGALILIRVQGSHFLWKMVRRIVGVLAAVGRGAMTMEQVDALIQGREPSGAELTPASLTAPAAGLFLEGVYYEGDPGPGTLKPMVPIE
jgi:tRNA pseudouridine38-40 synthase